MSIQISSVGGTFKQTRVVLHADTDTLIIAADPYRTFLALKNQDAGDVNLTFDGSPATANTGWALDGAPARGNQSVAGREGGSVTWDGTRVAQNEVRGFSAAGTTIVVLAG